jgi:flagellar hook-associated protein 3 FlgL
MLDAVADPAGAAAAVGVAGEIDHLAYDAGNAQSSVQQIQSGLNILQQVSTLIDQFHQTALQAANTGASKATREALASTAQQGLQQLVQLANSQDSDGRYIFAGSKASAAPFQTLPSGEIIFAGDAGTNVIEVAPSLTMPVALSGQSIFMNTPAGDDGVAVAAAKTNTGSAVAVTQGVTNLSQLAAEKLSGTQYEIAFSPGAGGTLNYNLTSGIGDPASASFAASSGAVASGSFTPGADLLFGGVDVRITGTPAAGDRFVVQTAATSSLFQTIQDLVSALGPGEPDQQQIQNAVANLDAAQSSISGGQAVLGSSLAGIQAVQARDNTLETSAQVQLSNLQSANLPEVLANYSESITALQAAELAFAKIQNLSLFSLIQ